MNSQDITRALIDTTVARAMVEMDADPKRSVRKLCDLGRQFSRGRFQNQILPFFRIFCATMKARIIRRSTFCCAATIRKRFVSSASTSATTVLPTVRRFCARSRKNFPLLFPGLSSSVSTAASRTLMIPRFCIRGQNRSDIRHLLLSAPLHGSS